MAGCTDLPFRLVAREKGLELGFLEMVSANALARDSRKTLDMMRTEPGDRPLGAQLMGDDPEMMGAAAARIEEMGFDLVDLNLGCPAPKVTGGGERAGSALLRHPEKAERIFRSVVRAVRRIPVTVKMRIGYSDPSGDEAVEAARRAEGSGISAVTVHGRTRSQGYRGKADYRAIGRVKRAVDLPVIGNGDVFDGEAAKRLVCESGCDGVMIGRGGLGDPWLYREVEAALNGEPPPPRPRFEERRLALLRHLELEVRYRGEETAVRHMRRIACWYVSGIPGAAAFRGEICRAETAAEVREKIESLSP